MCVGRVRVNMRYCVERVKSEKRPNPTSLIFVMIIVSHQQNMVKHTTRNRDNRNEKEHRYGWEYPSFRESKAERTGSGKRDEIRKEEKKSVLRGTII